MEQIHNIQGRPYTTAAQDIALQQLASKFTRELGQRIVSAMRESKDGRLQLDVTHITDALEQAYYMGREDAGG